MPRPRRSGPAKRYWPSRRRRRTGSRGRIRRPIRRRTRSRLRAARRGQRRVRSLQSELTPDGREVHEARRTAVEDGLRRAGTASTADGRRVQALLADQAAGAPDEWRDKAGRTRWSPFDSRLTVVVPLPSTPMKPAAARELTVAARLHGAEPTAAIRRPPGRYRRAGRAAAAMAAGRRTCAQPPTAADDSSRSSCRR